MAEDTADKNKEPRALDFNFDMDQYCKLSSPAERIGYCDNFLRGMDPVWWRYLEHFRGKNFSDSLSDEIKQNVQDKVAKYNEELETGTASNLVPTLREYMSSSDIMNILGTPLTDASEDALAGASKLRDAIAPGFAEQWQEILNIFNLDDDLDKLGVKEVITWFRSKLDNRDVMILDSADPKHTEESLASIKSMISYLYSPFSLAPLSKMDASRADLLVIIADLIKPETNGVELLLTLAHEKAHEDLNTERQEAPFRGDDMFIVLTEFYPIIESQRVYELLSEDLKSKASYNVRMPIEMAEQLSDNRYNIEFDDEIVGVHDWNRIALVTLVAYAHSHNQINRSNE